MRASVLSACLLFACTATRAADWETTDSALCGGALGLLAVDWNQTRKTTSQETRRVYPPGARDIHGNPLDALANHYVSPEEQNPFLGHRPSNAEINRYFFTALSATAVACYALPQRWRRLILGSVVLVEAVVVIHNQQVGLGFRF